MPIQVLVWSRKYNSCKIETGLLCGDGAQVIRFFARVIQQLGFWTQKIEANVDYCYVRRRAECTSGREETCRGASRGIFFQQSIRAQHVSFCSECTLA